MLIPKLIFKIEKPVDILMSDHFCCNKKNNSSICTNLLVHKNLNYFGPMVFLITPFWLHLLILLYLKHDKN